MKEIKSIEIKDDKVKLVIEDRDRWGVVMKRQQMTFRRTHFERALTAANITVPWERVAG